MFFLFLIIGWTKAQSVSNNSVQHVDQDLHRFKAILGEMGEELRHEDKAVSHLQNLTHKVDVSQKKLRRADRRLHGLARRLREAKEHGVTVGAICLCLLSAAFTCFVFGKGRFPARVMNKGLNEPLIAAGFERESNQVKQITKGQLPRNPRGKRVMPSCSSYIGCGEAEFPRVSVQNQNRNLRTIHIAIPDHRPENGQLVVHGIVAEHKSGVYVKVVDSNLHGTPQQWERKFLFDDDVWVTPQMWTYQGHHFANGVLMIDLTRQSKMIAHHLNDDKQEFFIGSDTEDIEVKSESPRKRISTGEITTCSESSVQAGESANDIFEDVEDIASLVSDESFQVSCAVSEAESQSDLASKHICADSEVGLESDLAVALESDSDESAIIVNSIM